MVATLARTEPAHAAGPSAPPGPRDRPAARQGRHGRGLRGAATPPAPPGRAEDPGPVADTRPRGAGAVPPRDRGAGPARPPGDRPHLLGRADARRPRLLHDATGPR